MVYYHNTSPTGRSANHRTWNKLFVGRKTHFFFFFSNHTNNNTTTSPAVLTDSLRELRHRDITSSSTSQSPYPSNLPRNKQQQTQKKLRKQDWNHGESVRAHSPLSLSLSPHPSSPPGPWGPTGACVAQNLNKRTIFGTGATRVPGASYETTTPPPPPQPQTPTLSSPRRGPRAALWRKLRDPGSECDSYLPLFFPLCTSELFLCLYACRRRHFPAAVLPFPKYFTASFSPVTEQPSPCFHDSCWYSEETKRVLVVVVMVMVGGERAREGRGGKTSISCRSP